ncbi:MAG TPA: restriction endonuclease subunit S [Flavobacterium sp.]|nr:restriction endonuclease subunit S [Flavobacterium sp.]
MENIKPYTKYKSSGISWLGDVPEHWSIKRIKYVFKEQDKRSEIGLEDLLSVSHYTGVTRKSDKVMNGDFMTNAKTLVGYKIVEKGDLVINIMLAWNGSLGISKFDGITSPAYCVYKSLIGGEKYFGYLFRTKNAQQEFKKQSTGIIDSRLRLYTDKFFNIKTVIPSLEEQTAIAKFLDYKVAKIDRFIRKKKQIIKLLNEQKAGIINHAVTKGLDPIATMKDSGIEWLGEIPEHWIVRKIGRSIKGIGSGTTPLSSNTHFYENGTINWINSGDLNDNLVYECKKQITQKAFNETSSLKKFPKGTLTVAMYGATIGKVGLLQIEATTNQACCNIPINSFYDTKFLMYWFMGNRKHIINLSYGGGQPNISQDTIKSLHIPCTSIEEQQAIVEHIEKETSKLITTIQTIEKEIALTQEYRTALIAEAVTGKIDVRAFVIPTVSVQEELYEEIEEELDMVAEDAENYENE